MNTLSMLLFYFSILLHADYTVAEAIRFVTLCGDLQQTVGCGMRLPVVLHQTAHSGFTAAMRKAASIRREAPLHKKALFSKEHLQIRPFASIIWQ
jgi:hypothetical protein